jgi:hypothetical protein
MRTPDSAVGDRGTAGDSVTWRRKPLAPATTQSEKQGAAWSRSRQFLTYFPSELSDEPLDLGPPRAGRRRDREQQRAGDRRQTQEQAGKEGLHGGLLRFGSGSGVRLLPILVGSSSPSKGAGERTRPAEHVARRWKGRKPADRQDQQARGCGAGKADAIRCARSRGPLSPPFSGLELPQATPVWAFSSVSPIATVSTTG